MYRLLSQRVRWQLLASLSKRESSPLSGCWLRDRGSSRWRSWNGTDEPVEGNFYLWKSLGICLASPTALGGDQLRRLRGLYRRGLFQRLRRQMLSQWASSLKCQRNSLARQLHRGLCQRVTVVQLQRQWVGTCTLAERAQAERDLFESIGLLSAEFGQFFQNQFAFATPSDAVDWAAVAPNQAAEQFCRELVLMASGLDPNLEMKSGRSRMTLRFACPPEQRTSLRPLLRALRWAGIRVQQGPDVVTLDLF